MPRSHRPGRAMNQQVNLLAPMFRKQPTLFSARLSLILCALVIGVLGVIYLGTVWRAGLLAREQVRLEARRDTVVRQLDELAAQLKGGGKSQELTAERDRLATERERKAHALAALSRRELGNTTGFSPQFIGLARQRVGGLWLTRIELTAGGQQMELRGMTRSEELIPRYLRKLGGEAVFAGTQFEHAVLQRGEAPGSDLSFELRTQLAGVIEKELPPPALAPGAAVAGDASPSGDKP